MKRTKNPSYEFKTRNRLTEYNRNDYKISSIKNYRSVKTKDKASYKNFEDDESVTPKASPNNSILKQIDLICKKIYKNPRITIDKNIIKVNYINDSNKMNFYFGNRNDNLYNNKNIAQMPLKSISNRDRFNYKSINNLNVPKKGEDLLLNKNKKEEIIFTKKFNKIGINTIDFFIEGKLTNMNGIFCDCKSLIKIEFISIDTSKVKDMSYMFSGCNSLEYLDLTNFDTSNVEYMEGMFCGCLQLKEIKGINNFNTSQIKNMSYMFFCCDSLEYLDLSSFDTSNAEDMNHMFQCCSKLKEIKGINNFNIKRKCDTYGIFEGCHELDHSTKSDNQNSTEKTEKTIAIMFFIPDQNIHCPIPCNESDSFSKIENKLFEEFPELKSKNIYYLVSGNTVDKTLTLKENKIKNGNTILVE